MERWDNAVTKGEKNSSITLIFVFCLERDLEMIRKCIIVGI